MISIKFRTLGWSCYYLLQSGTEISDFEAAATRLRSNPAVDLGSRLRGQSIENRAIRSLISLAGVRQMG